MKKEEVVVISIDNHRVIEFDDHHEVRCDVVGNVYLVYSENGTIKLHCPGCGCKMEEVKHV